MITIRQALMPMALLAAAALSACGGGGGGNDGAPSTPLSTGQYAITAENYDQVIASTGSATARASNSGRNASGSDGSQLVGAESRVLNWSQLAQSAVSQVLAQQGGQAMLLGAASTTNCKISGSMTTAAEGGAADGGLAVNEVITIDYAGCMEEQGSRLDGRIKLKVTNLSAEREPVGMSLDFTSFKATDAAMSETITGSMAVTVLPDLYVVNSPALNLVTTSGSTTQTEAWTDFLYTFASSSSGRQLTFSGALLSSKLGNQSVEVTTPVAVAYVGEASVPNSGKIVIKGANNSIATLTVNSETTPVTIAVDSNGDGTADKSKTVDWNQIVGGDFN